MIGGWMPWRRLLAAWLPAVLLCLVAVGVLLWQTSGTLGYEAQIRQDVVELQESIDSLESMQGLATRDRQTVADLDGEIQRIYEEVFGSADERLTDILREVERAAREAQMRPGRFGYDAEEAKAIGCVRFSISYSVIGHYEQIRRMIGILQSSPEFLTIESVTLRGEEDPTTQDVRISIRLNTYLAEADPERLLRQAGAIGGSNG